MNRTHALSMLATSMLATMTVLLGACAVTKPVHFEWPQKHHRVVLMPTDIELSELSAGGVEVPNAEWTKNAKLNFLRAMRDQLALANADVVETTGGLEQPKIQTDLIKLHEAVSAEVLIHQPGAIYALPTKLKDPMWTLGPSTREFKKRFGADYALFISVRDSYASGGRVAAMILAAATMGVSIQGGHQRGFASLVDLETGNMVWHNSLFRSSGDMRTIKGARETTNLLLQGFPK